MIKQRTHQHSAGQTREFAHDIRNLLCVISGRIRILEKILLTMPVPGMGGSSVDHQMTCLNRAIRQAAALCETVNADGLIGYVHMSDVTDVVHECCDMVSPLISDGIKLTTDLDHNRPSVACDALQLNRMLLNLMKNGLESMQDCGGELKLSTGQMQLNEQDMELFICDSPRQAGDYVYLEVKDQGCGMDAQAFMNNPAELQSKQRGFHGYGLKSVLAIVNTYHGLMHVQSQPEQGTAVRVFFPCLPVESLQDEMADVVSDQVMKILQDISQRTKSQKL